MHPSPLQFPAYLMSPDVPEVSSDMQFLLICDCLSLPKMHRKMVCGLRFALGLWILLKLSFNPHSFDFPVIKLKLLLLFLIPCD